VTIGEGLWADVWFWQGDFMPVCSEGTVTPVGREIRIYQVATIADVTAGPRVGSYREVQTPLVDTVQSDRFGFFEADVPPGTYSVFAVEDTLLLTNGVDDDGNVHPVVVRDGQVTSTRLDITYQASF
jgi:hypothetical protein